MIWAVSLLSDELSSAVLTAMIVFIGIRSLLRVGTVSSPSPLQSSTPDKYHMTLALKLFRGEPAISEFDWHFTANHKSSKHIAACPGSALHYLLRQLQPAHG